MLFTIWEIIDIVVMSIALGFIFRKILSKYIHRTPTKDIVHQYINKIRGFHFNDFWIAVLVAAPVVILHELGHKFTAMSFGLAATFHAAYFWLALGVFLSLANIGVIFFIPAYVSYNTLPTTTPAQLSLIAVMGPLVNFVIFIIALILLKYWKIKNQLTRNILHLTKQINLLLFVFNMIPLPGFDGYHFFSNLVKVF